MVTKNDIKILDCTLRDGGYVNNFEFGNENIKNIVRDLSLSGVDLVELGFLKNGNHNSNQTLFNHIQEAEYFAEKSENPNQDFCMMIRPDWYDIEKLSNCTGRITTLRFAFHYRDLDLTLEQANIARNLGYKIIFNPVNILSYSKQKLEHLLPILNDFNPRCVSIVDTFGSLLPSDLNRLFKIFDDHLNQSITLALHLHENLSISLALAIIFIDLIQNKRNGIIDSSILGIGRIPGNLCTELIMSFMNKKLNKNYNLNHIYNLIDNPISSFKINEPWGYMPAYAITAYNKIHRSYAEYLLKKPNITTNQINSILNCLVTVDEKENFDQSLADYYYEKIVSENK